MNLDVKIQMWKLIKVSFYAAPIAAGLVIVFTQPPVAFTFILLAALVFYMSISWTIGEKLADQLNYEIGYSLGHAVEEDDAPQPYVDPQGDEMDALFEDALRMTEDSLDD